MPTRRAPKPNPKVDDTASDALRMLKKYPNRRLYDTRDSSYITLTDVKRMVLGGEAFQVVDAKSGEDLTRSILLQIILEEESGGVPMFSTPMLAQIIRFYGHAMQGMMGTVMEHNLQAFVEWQEQFVGKTPAQLATAPMQALMDNYIEQTRKLYAQMQQAGSLFSFTPPQK